MTFANYPTFEITTAIPCINHCSCCPQNNLIKVYKGQPTLSFTNFCQILNNLPKHVQIDFAGFCEPLQNPDSFKMIDKTIRDNRPCMIYTTLSIKLEDIDLSIWSKATICVHLPDNNHFITDSTVILQNIELISKHNSKIIFVSLGQPTNDFNDLSVLKLPIISRANNLNFNVNYKSGPITCQKVHQLPFKYVNNVCLPNGDVYICCCDFSLKHKIGNIFDRYYNDLFNTIEYNDFLRRVKSEDEPVICRNCEYSKRI